MRLSLFFQVAFVALLVSGAWSPVTGDIPDSGLSGVPAEAGGPEWGSFDFGTGLLSWAIEPIYDSFGRLVILLSGMGGDGGLDSLIESGGVDSAATQGTLTGSPEVTNTPIPINPYADVIEVVVDSPASGTTGEPGSGDDSSLQYGGVYIHSYPSGIPIVLDGKTLEAPTPKIVFGLSEGLHTVKISNDRKIFSVTEKKVWVYKGIISRVEFNIDPKITDRKITIQSDSYFSGDEFTVNGKYPVYTIPTSITVDRPESFITIHHNGSYIRRDISSFIYTGDTMNLLFSTDYFDSTSGRIRVLSDPDGADVLVDGFPTGLKTPCVIENLSDGVHYFAISKPGYIPQEKSFRVMFDPRNDIEGEVKASLDPYVYGELAANSSPTGATVVIDKYNFRRKTPCVLPFMPIGSYSMKVSQGGTTRNVEFIIKPKTRIEFDFTSGQSTIIKRESGI
ncbi:MAG: PEGA domain-containing protein [Methanoregulaceae archaeon]|jgi:hypothetical protein